MVQIGNLAAEEDVAVEAEAHALARFGKAAGFQTHRRP